ncbi:Helitron helicase [Phytophthora megakarya]|uniref:Helitron helicase n=1 Tax=Phytophthora megakarya TaxID=4795 RepID=A0A225VQU3_9STRA|nr:Helitron helicase [Phytophthora megakarya]
MTGERRGQHVLIPRIIFISDNEASEFPFRLRRKQFPVQPEFAMAINKAQGQTVQYLGLILENFERSRFMTLIENVKAEEDGGVYTENIYGFIPYD